ncbi:radical SAM protein [Leisingera sp. ANG59]|uniref:SPL family radical SAM protein n=1 Tax=Leisingera sp. ANG59 TaxID=2675221 RepID=UPI001574A7BA|nr:radical SAM protein [Leisingera sp. ANG59]NSY39321.1 radical SAM protein [Leisingera sp. ANG59]
MRVSEYEAKSLIQNSKIPSIDYVANPYTGCDFGCAYCYASFSGRFVGEPVKEWGNFVAVKTNAVALVRKELEKMSAEKKRGTILLSSVTDPYMGIEKKREITRGILGALVGNRWSGIVRILTKSPIVTRDIDLLKQLPQSEVGLTVTTTDDAISRWLEVRAPSATRRLHTLKELHEAGIRTFAFVGPLLPHFAEQPELLDTLLGRLAETGVREVYMEHINLKRYIVERMNKVLEGEPDSVQAAYKNARKASHRERMDDIVAELLNKHGLRLRFDEVVYHDEFQAKHAGGS